MDRQTDAPSSTPARTLAFVGCLTRDVPYSRGARGQGIAVFDFDETTGALTPLSVTGGIDNPTWLVLNADASRLYATSEVAGWNEGTVSAYRVDAASGTLHYINKQPTLGSIAAHAALDRSGRHLLVANYGHGTPGEVPGQAVAVLPLRPDGGLLAACSSVAHAGAGPVAGRQEAPHPHCVLPGPDNRFVLVADLGIDAVLTYGFDALRGTLEGLRGRCALPPGAGPRHLAFHPGGHLVFVINELDSTVATLACDAATGTLTPLHSAAALPGGFAGQNHCAGLAVSGDGRFLYGSNRGHDSIAAFAIDAATGRLTPIGHAPGGGGTPRSFAPDPSGRFLLVANQAGDSLIVFGLDGGGLPRATGQRVAIGTPMCVTLARCGAARPRAQRTARVSERDGVDMPRAMQDAHDLDGGGYS